MCRYIYLSLFVILLIPSLSFAERLHDKRWYQERWCAKYFDNAEVSVSDQYDCLSEKYVIEFDYADLWYESIGESLHYALQTGRKAGIVLIMEKDSDMKYWIKLKTTIQHYNLPINVWNTSP
ncbi:MAG: hypothetical protein GY697_21125 [Desulfobacterales bacterium]|nr:hypothetical protein [Desulfobacterales bacterium]